MHKKKIAFVSCAYPHKLNSLAGLYAVALVLVWLKYENMASVSFSLGSVKAVNTRHTIRLILMPNVVLETLSKMDFRYPITSRIENIT